MLLLCCQFIYMYRRVKIIEIEHSLTKLLRNQNGAFLLYTCSVERVKWPTTISIRFHLFYG